MFSERSDPSGEPSPLAKAALARRSRGEPILDLGAGAATLGADEAGWREALRSAPPADPHPLGDRRTRAHIARQLERDGAEIDASRIVLTTSASDAYVRLFTLLCDPGEELLAPELDAISRAATYAGAIVTPYSPRLEHDRLRADPGELWDAVGERTRAIVLSSPCAGGSYLRRDEAEAFAALGAPLIVLETDYDLALDPPVDRVRAASLAETLVFGIGAAPWAAWITVSGPANAVSEALARLEAMADGPSPIEPALPALLAATARDAAIERARANLARLRAVGELYVPRVEGGALAPVRAGAEKSDEAWALALLERGVHVPTGSAYGLDEDGPWLAPSLLAPEDDFARGVAVMSEVLRSA
jgi:alanine-synthesizing transaminase